jgi:signal peptidase I
MNPRLGSRGETRSVRLLAGVFVGLLVVIAVPLVMGVSGGAYRLPTPSMYPTLAYNERLVASPSWTAVGRGDVIIFWYPIDRTKSYIKRVIALGGDTIEIRDGRPIINGKPAAQQRTDERCESDAACTIWTETLGSKTYRIAFQNSLSSPEYGFRNYGPAIVPSDKLFVLGDNRDNSADSRHWGFVPVGDVHGRPTVIYWSSDNSGVHWNRLFQRIP